MTANEHPAKFAILYGLSDLKKLPDFPRQLRSGPFDMPRPALRPLFAEHRGPDEVPAKLMETLAEKFYPPVPTEDQRFPGGHPEQYADEVFMGNYEDSSWLMSNYSTKRTGRKAYDIHGQLVPGTFPVFVKRVEVEERGWVVTADGRIGHSPTGRLSRSEPEVQHFPGTPQARAQSRKLRAAREAGSPELMDFSALELRILKGDPFDH